MMSVELFQADKHYAAITEWWKAQKWPAVPLSHLSKTGIVVYHDGKPAAACWLFKTDSAICWLEWIVASPEVRRETRASVLSTLISTTKMLAQVMGFETIFTSLKNEAMSSRIKPHGFNPTDQGVTQFMCHLNGGN